MLDSWNLNNSTKQQVTVCNKYKHYKNGHLKLIFITSVIQIQQNNQKNLSLKQEEKIKKLKNQKIKNQKFKTRSEQKVIEYLKAKMQIGLKHTKSIDEYRHNVKLLKYYLKKEQRINETLKYKSMKNEAKMKNQQKNLNKPKQRIYSMFDTVMKLNKRLKEMGLGLGDIFRMADSQYEGQINKAGFAASINHLKAEIGQSLINQMFYAIDTNLNGILDQDQYLQFLCAHGGADSKDAHKFQRKSLQKFAALLRKKSIKPDSFIADSVDPINVYEFKKKICVYALNQNQIMILLKAFDPQNEGCISHQFFIESMKRIKQKNQQTIKNEQMDKDIKYLCVAWRQRKVNPIKIFQQADVDRKDGVSQIQLQDAFQKLMPGQTKFQIKKWVGLINLNNDKQISRQEFINSIRSFYALNQLQKFSSQWAIQNPNAKRAIASEQVPIQKIIKQLQQHIVDRKMTNKTAFASMDINGNGTLDKQELSLGLNKMGLNILFIGSVLSVFDRNSDGDIQLNQWLKILGEDVDFQSIDIPAIKSSEEDQIYPQNDFKKKKEVAKKQPKPLKQKINQKVQNKKVQNKNSQNPKKTPIQNKQKSESIRQSGKQKTQKIKQNQIVKNDQNKIKGNDIKKRAINNIKFQQEQVKQKSPIKKSAIPTKNKNQKQSLIKDEYQDQFEHQREIQTQQLQKQMGIQYKKRPQITLSKFREFDKRNKRVVNLRDLKSVLQRIQGIQFTSEQANRIFQQNISNDGFGMQYQDWLNFIAQKYAQNVNRQQIDNPLGTSIRNNAQQQRDQPISKLKDGEIVSSGNILNEKLTKRGLQAQKSNQIKIQFNELLNLISKEGVHVEKGYKLMNHVSGSEQIEKLQKVYLPKAQRIKSKKIKFSDSQFPPIPKSITDKPDQSQINGAKSLSWKHYSEVFRNPVLFQGTIQPNDIKQGGLGNCYFLSALACLAQYSNLIQRLFEYYDIQNGYFLLWFCIDGVWKIIQIDGNIVVNANGTQPAFSRSDKQQLWVILLEKAYAKAYGNYERIVGGTPSQAIKDLSGSPSYITSHSKSNPDQLWRKVYQANLSKFIMAAGTQVGKKGTKAQDHQQTVTKQGIVLGHAYSILDVQQVNKQRIIQLRNPWGKIQWNGDWCDTSKKWTSSLREQLKYVSNLEDGIFWMPFEQYFKRYGATSINYLRPTYFYQSTSQPKVKCLTIKISNPELKQGYVMISQADHRRQGIKQGSPYVLTNIISLVGEKDKLKVVRKVQQKNFKYQRQAEILIRDLRKDQQAVVIVTLEEQADVNISFYGNCKVDFQIQTQTYLDYLEGLALLQQHTANRTGDLLYWFSSVGDKAFLCFKNLSSTKNKYTVLTPQLINLQVMPPQKHDRNILNIKKGQSKSIRGIILDRSKNFSFSSFSIQ